MSSAKIKQLVFFQLVAALIVSAVSCNSKTTEEDSDIVVTQSLVAVRNFYLMANDSVMKNLDSISFSIDLNNGVIFNADSLPKGTKVDRLIPSITFANTMTKAELSFLRDNETDTIVDYLKNPEDSIDFTYPVLLEVTAADGTSSFTYEIKVNVHKQNPDSLMWDNLSVSSLPSKYSNPVAQKTLSQGTMVYCFVEEYNGEYTLASSNDLNQGYWNQFSPILSFTPEISSFSATDEAFWILGTDGLLYTSDDALNWNSTGQYWTGILGNYNDYILGIRLTESGYVHTIYPESPGFVETPLEENFPISNYSSLGIIETKWANRPMAIICGGILQDGSVISSVWAYDGTNWAIINESSLPALADPMMVRYVVYRETPYLFVERELDIWLLFGGIDAAGEMNREVFMSYDNGVTWIAAPEGMQLPEIFPTLSGASLIVTEYDLSADLSDAWQRQEITKSRSKTRASYTIDGYDITWECPYLYVFGGYLPSGVLSTEIWRGVLERLKFTPLI